MFAHIGAAFSLKCLIVTISGPVHQINESAIAIICEEFIPFASPYNLDDIPTCATEDRLKFLNDLAITADRSVEALQVAVDNKVKVVESFASCQADCAQSLWLIALTISKEGPDILI